MIFVNSILGNIVRDEKLRRVYIKHCQMGQCEKIVANRIELQRLRLRKTSDKGTDVAIALEPGILLRNGDILFRTSEKIIVVELEPENVAILSFKQEDATDDEMFMIAVKVGHAIGNLHRPIKVEDNRVILPIQADCEIDLLNKIFLPIIDHLNIAQARMIFEPTEGLHTHEH